MPRDAMMQLLLAAFFFVFAFAELRVWNKSTFTGLESSNPAHQPADRASTRHLQDCEVIGWAELCERKKLTAGSCFQLEPTVAAPPCELQGPHGAPAQLRPAAGKILTLTSGELHITGQIQMTSLRLQAKTVNFADAHVESWHEGPSDPNSNAHGGAFLSNGSITLTRSRLTVRGAAADIGGGFAADGNLSVFHSEVVIQNVSAKQSGGGFFVLGSVYISDNSMILIQNARSTETGGGFIASGEVEIAGKSTVNISNSHAETGDGGGFYAEKGLKVSTGSFLNLENVNAGSHGGGFIAFGEVEIAGKSTVNISNSHAETGDGGGFDAEKGLKVSTGSKLNIRNAKAGQNGGGFYAFGEVEIAGKSTVNMSHSHAGGNGGGFDAEKGLKVSTGSFLNLENVTARFYGGGFIASGEVEIAGKSTVNITGSKLNIRNAKAGQNGGGFKAEDIVISSSTLSIQDATAWQHGGGFVTSDEVVIDRMSNVSIFRSKAENGAGGGFFTFSYVEVTNSSFLNLETVTAQEYGGGFYAGRGEGNGEGCMRKGLKVSTGSKLNIRNAKAGPNGGGGFIAFGEVEIAGKSTVNISNSRAGGTGGGFYAEKGLKVSTGSFLNLENLNAGSHGGGFIAFGEVEIAEKSTVNISNSHAETGDGGGFDAEKGLKVSTGSKLNIRNAKAGQDGGGFSARGGFYAESIVISSSNLSIQDAIAGERGGGFAAGVVMVEASTVAMFSTDAGAYGGAFAVIGLRLQRSSMSISNSTALRGSGGLADGPVLVSEQSTLVVKHAQALDNSSVLAASCFYLLNRSHMLFEDVIGGHGVELQNSGCSALCSKSTFRVAEDAALNASGRLSSGLLSIAACPKEKVFLSGIHLHSWSSALLSTRPSYVVVDQVSVDYKPPVNNLQVLAAKDFQIDSVTVSCPNCARGVTLHATKDGSLKALSSEHLQCPKTVEASKGKMHRCNCSNYQIAVERFRDVDLVPLESVLQTCAFCKPHFHFQNGDCSKCGIFSAWSDGKTDVCYVLPPKKMELITLLIGAAVVVTLTFIALQILHAPLIIVDAKSHVADSTQAESKKIFMLSVQGPIVDLHKGMSRLVHRWVRYRARGTGLIWLDYEQKKSNAVKVQNTGDRKLLLKDMNPPFDCASCKGSLHAADFLKLLSLLAACISVTAMLPAIIKVAVISGNGVGHVFVTAIFVTLPLVAAAALLHFPVAWLIQWLYRRTPFSRALDEYRKQITCKEDTGPDAAHPRNQGLQVLILHGLWKHFESFILDRNMHFVVANIVRPLTRSKQVSFVTLWGGRQLDYFVSHCWGANFSHSVRSIQCHALSKEGPTSWFDAAYWICSFANNQWNIGAELGNDPMGSAFAHALTSGIKGVAMVLDEEVQPLTRVWCLFEFFLSTRERLELVFVTNAGVVGDDRCSSFDIALEVGKKIKSLQVATCEASSEKDKKDIFEYIISELGSLERMDEKIRKLMAEMLMQNLANVEKATGSLVDSLGECSATVATLDKDDRL